MLVMRDGVFFLFWNCEMRWISGEDMFTQSLHLVRFLKGYYM
jgi:hypothetical protein